MMRNFTRLVGGALMTCLAIVSMLSLANAQIGQSLWKYATPKSVGWDIFGSSFVNDNHGIIVGSAGGIARTIDGGANWTDASFWYLEGNNPVIPTFNDVHFVSFANAYAVGTQGVMIKSIDGGYNWTKLANPFEATKTEIKSVSFINDNVGYIVGLAIGGATASGKTSLYKTTDGGATWTLEPNLPKWPGVRTGTCPTCYYDTTRAKDLWRVRFTKENVGYVTGASGLVWKYNGSGWKDYSITNYRLGYDTTQSAYRPTTGPQVYTVNAFSIVDDTLVVTTSLNTTLVVRISTAADTPRMAPGNTSNVGGPRNMAKAANGKLFLVSSGTVSSGYYVSNDTGRTWQSSYVYPPTASFDQTNPGLYGAGLQTISTTPNGRVFFAGRWGSVADSLNGVWRRPYYNAQFVANGGFSRISFANSLDGIAVGGVGTILRTRDGGYTWDSLSNQNDRNGFIGYPSVSYVKPDSLFLINSQGQLKFSSDKAETFDILFSDTVKNVSTSLSPQFTAMYWLDGLRGWIASSRDGGNGSTTNEKATSVIFRTTDGGYTWDSLSNQNDRNGFIGYPSVSYVKPDSLFLINSQGQLKFSADKAETFDILFSDTVKNTTTSLSPQFTAMYWLDGLRGWIASSRDGGNGSTTNEKATSVIFRTTDGGYTWDSVKQFLIITPNATKPTDPDTAAVYINNIQFVNQNVGYLVGSRSAVYRTDDGGLNWTRVYYDEPNKTGQFYGLTVVDMNTVYISGTSGRVLKTTDGGVTWTSVRANLPNNFAQYRNVIAYDANKVFVTDANLLWYTENGGGVWQVFPSPLSGETLYHGTFTKINPGCGQPICNALWFVGSLRAQPVGFAVPSSIIKFGSDFVLPVKFGKLTGTPTAKGNQLFWSAFAQSSVSYYEVEASADGVSWKTVNTSRILPSGFETESHNWLHMNAPTGTTYYRVKAVEKDGSVYYTNIVKLNSRTPGAPWTWQVSNGKLVLRNAELPEGPLTIRVLNSAGQQVAAKAWTTRPAGVFNDMINLPMQLRGALFVQILRGTTPESLTIFVE